MQNNYDFILIFNLFPSIFAKQIKRDEKFIYYPYSHSCPRGPLPRF